MRKILCINNFCTDPHFNLATEEYFLKNSEHDIFMLWSNEPVIVVGKHQNIHAEINHEFIQKNEIKLARRLSGGGTVYHDLNNLNFTYIMTGEVGKMVDFKKYTDDILKVLNKLGANAKRNERNDLTINGFKISGNAEHIFKQRVIHHGTLLFDSDLDILNEAIKVSEKKYHDKAVQSFRSKVTNIVPHFKENISLNDFRNELIGFALNKYPNAINYEISDLENIEIQKLKDNKYITWDWIYGYSPKYILKKSIQFKGGEYQLEIKVKKGCITNFEITEGIDNHYLNKMMSALIGERHDKLNITKKLNSADIEVDRLDIDKFINSLF